MTKVVAVSEPRSPSLTKRFVAEIEPLTYLVVRSWPPSWRRCSPATSRPK